jgi:hypothetical protein
MRKFVAARASRPAVSSPVIVTSLLTDVGLVLPGGSQVQPLLLPAWDGPNGGIVEGALTSLDVAKARVKEQLGSIREDTLRYLNPTPYKVSVSGPLFDFFHKLWEDEMPIAELG